MTLKLSERVEERYTLSDGAGCVVGYIDRIAGSKTSYETFRVSICGHSKDFVQRPLAISALSEALTFAKCAHNQGDLT